MGLSSGFFGGTKEAVKLLTERGCARSIDAALTEGDALLSRGVVVSMAGKHALKNDDSYYCFKARLSRKGENSNCCGTNRSCILQGQVQV